MLPAVLLALALAAPAPVSAEAALEAEELAHRSALEYDLGHAAEALRDIERAYLLDPLPGLLFNLGQCHRKLKHWEQAETAYRSYLHHQPNAPNIAAVKALIDEMQREQVASVVPELTPALPASVIPTPHAAPTPPPAPAATLVLPAAPPPAPPASIEVWPEKKQPASTATAWPWVFAATAAVAAGFSIAGFVQMANYASLKSGSTAQTPTPYPAAQSAESNYAWGEPLGVVGAVVAVAGVGGMIWTW